MESNIFFISSFGGTATKWLSLTLSGHPEIECFHEFQKITGSTKDPYQLDVKPVRQFVDDLLHWANRSGKYLGAVHRYHGLQAYKAITSAGGRFCAVTRDPISRINSLYHFHLDDHKHKASICRAVSRKYESLIFDHGETLTENELIFLWVAGQTLRYDFELANLPRHQMFKMEELTQDETTFSRLVSYLTRDSLSFTSAELQSIFSKGKVNQHAAKSQNPQDIAAQWSQSQRSLVKRLLNSLRPSPFILNRVYESYGYRESGTALESILLS